MAKAHSAHRVDRRRRVFAAPQRAHRRRTPGRRPRQRRLLPSDGEVGGEGGFASEPNAVGSGGDRQARRRARRRRGRSVMLTCIRGGRVIDPAQRRDAVGDIWIDDDRIVQPPAAGARADAVHDASGMVVMAGAIDIHSHIAGANVNTARLLLPEWRRGAAPRSELTPLSSAGWTTRQTGRDYAAMGFTTVVEPAIAPHQALHAHLELADVPIIDKAILCVLGNDDYLLRSIRDKASAA